MSKKLLFAIIATICATTAFADIKTVTTKDYVDNNFQTKIPANSFELWDENFPSIVSTTQTSGQVGQMGVVTYNIMNERGEVDNLSSYNAEELAEMDNLVMSWGYGAILEDEIHGRQFLIPKSGKYQSNSNHGREYNSDLDWLSSSTKGVSLVTRTTEDSFIGERKIIETADVANYGTGTATQQQIQEISIPTMGAVMAAISANAPTLPTGTAGNVVTYNAQGNIGGSVATYNGSTTYNASNDASKIAVMSAVQRKMTCARYVQNADQTAENCLLWNVPD